MAVVREKERCLDIVYADSLSPVAAPGFQFSHNSTYPQVLDDFRRSFALLGALPCDILLTPHPESADILEHRQLRDSGAVADAFITPNACREYADIARINLERRLASERNTR